MKAIYTFTIFLILLSSSIVSYGQDSVEDENWLKGFGTEADYMSTLIYWDFKRYSLKDIPQAKIRLNVIREYKPKTEWEGLYYSNTGIGDSKLIWNKKGGFFNFYFYHTLKSFSFGKIKDFSGFVELNDEKRFISSISKTSEKRKLVKVKIGEKHFLVPEKRLPDFCELAAGLVAVSSDIDYYWTKEEDMKKSVFGLTTLPNEYRKYLRYPAEAKIIHIASKKIIPNKQSAKDYNYDDIHYPVTLNAGRNKKLEIGMNVFVEALGEWIQITKVSQNKAAGFIRRSFDKNNKEQCWDSKGGSGEPVSCKEIKIGMSAKTKSDL